MLTGVVRTLGTNGFGFIAPDRGGGEFWIRAQRDDGEVAGLAEGDAVVFDFHFGELGPEALNVRRLAG